MADKVLDLDWTETEDVLSKMNESTIIRVVLPDLINNALVTAVWKNGQANGLIDQKAQQEPLLRSLNGKPKSSSSQTNQRCDGFGSGFNKYESQRHRTR